MIEKTEEFNDEKHYQRNINLVLRIGFIALLFVGSYLILKPFLAMVLWGIIIAVAIFPMHKKFSKVLGNREKLSATLIVFMGISLLVIPSVFFTSSTIDSVKEISTQMDAGTLQVPAPDADVADWPLIGKPIYEAWLQASKSLSGLFEMFAPQIKEFAPSILSFATGLAGTLLLFIVSLIISGALLVNTKSAEKAAKLIFSTLAGKEGKEFAKLASATIRGVVQGVLGTAVLQTIFLSIGLFAIGFPGAGVVSLIILFVAIIQLPLAVIILPVIIYVFSYANTTPAVIFAIWSLAWGISDSFIKPILMGRGVDIPMLVILLGAIGGMMLGGIIGLFIGAVVLAFAYQTFQAILMKNAEVTEQTES